MRIAASLVLATTAAAQPSPPTPAVVLVGLYRQAAPEPGTASIRTGTGFKTVYRLTLPVQAGDLLRIHGQIEVTNNTSPLPAEIGLLQDGRRVGTRSAQHCLPRGGHHMPLWSEAGVVAATSGSTTIEAQVQVTHSVPGVSVRIENSDYGHLVVEQYRAVKDVTTATGVWLLQGIAAARTRLSTAFAATAYQRAPIYQTTLNARVGDLVRLHGQATSGFVSAGGTTSEMQGQGVFLGDNPLTGRKISAWSTENFYVWQSGLLPVPKLTLCTAAVDTIQAEEDLTPTYTLTLHGVQGNGVGHDVVDQGHLYAMHFTSATSGGHSLHTADETRGPAAPAALPADGVWRTLLLEPRPLLAGDVVRATGLVQLAHPPGLGSNLSNALRIVIVDPQGNPVDQSARSVKNSNTTLAQVPLRAELVTVIPTTATHRIALQARAGGAPGSPPVTLVGDRTHLFLEAFRQVGAATATGPSAIALGATADLDLQSTADSGLPYIALSSLGQGPLPLGYRCLALDPDPLLMISVTGLAPAVFAGYAGVLDPTGRARARMTMPSIPALAGLRVFTAFVTLRGSGIESISSTHALDLTR